MDIITNVRKTKQLFYTFDLEISLWTYISLSSFSSDMYKGVYNDIQASIEITAAFKNSAIAETIECFRNEETYL